LKHRGFCMTPQQHSPLLSSIFQSNSYQNEHIHTARKR
jgi:hypothetical protein